jgi:hypothetical protein
LRHGDGQRFGRAAAEGEPEDGGQQDREHEHPEDRLGLAEQLAHARERQLDERVPDRGRLRHRAASAR